MGRLLVNLAAIRLIRLRFASSQFYMDPGSGSMILQILLGGVAGLGVMLKLFWHRIIEVRDNRRSKRHQEDSTDQQ